MINDTFDIEWQRIRANGSHLENSNGAEGFCDTVLYKESDSASVVGLRGMHAVHSARRNALLPRHSPLLSPTVFLFRTRLLCG